MSLPNILLGLIEQPCSGYAIKQTFEQALRYFWNADLAQIYPALKKLENNGLAISSNAPSQKGPPRKLYQRTEAGTRQFRQWLLDGPEMQMERLQYLTQVYFLGSLPVSEQTRFFCTMRDYFTSQLQELQAIDNYWAAEDPRYPDQLPADDQVKQFTLRLGLSKIATLIEWCESCLATLRLR